MRGPVSARPVWRRACDLVSIRVAVFASGPPLAVAAVRSDGGRTLGGGRRVARRIGVDLEDPKAQHPVGDLQAVVEPLEQVRLALETVVAIVRLVPLTDLVGELAHAPDVCAVERSRPLDLLADVARDLLARVVPALGVEHQYEFIVPVHSDGRL